MAIDIRGKTRDVRLLHNEIRETRAAAQRVGVRIAASAEPLQLVENQIEGFATNVLDQRQASQTEG